MADQQEYDITLMLQRQAEVCSLLRERITSEAGLPLMCNSFHRLQIFFDRMYLLGTKLGLTPELIYQCLLHIHHGARSFDQQHRDGNVPMHQAKILDRTAVLAEANVESKLRSAVSDSDIEEMVLCSNIVRKILRMKVEDNNDLGMARKAVKAGDEYFLALENASKGDVAILWQMYNADSAAALKKLIYGDSFDEANEAASAIPPLPDAAHLVPSMAAIIQCCGSTTTPVASRLHAIATLTAWMGQLPSWNSCPQFIAAITTGVKVQLGEKRSALCKATSQLVTIIAERSQAEMAIPAVRDGMIAWLDIILKQVHVTVATIADATDLTARDIVIATNGLPGIAALLVSVASKATQPELVRKCLGYSCLALLATPEGDRKARLHGYAALAKAHAGHSAEGVRRVARALGIILREVDPSCVVWDDKTNRLAAAETATVIGGAVSLAEFERTVLRYEVPCRMTSAPRVATLPAPLSVEGLSGGLGGSYSSTPKSATGTPVFSETLRRRISARP